MRAAILILAALSAPAMAAEDNSGFISISQWPNTFLISPQNANKLSLILANGEVFEVRPDNRVFVNTERAQAFLRLCDDRLGHPLTAQDPTTCAIVRAILAMKDGKWEALP
jgi:hypothetical protein